MVHPDIEYVIYCFEVTVTDWICFSTLETRFFIYFSKFILENKNKLFNYLPKLLGSIASACRVIL